MHKLANKLCWGLALIVVWAGLVVGWPAADSVSLSAATTTTDAAPTYHFDKTWYQELGVVAYNDYLQNLATTQPLPTVTVAVIDSGLDYTCSSVFDGRVNTAYARNYNYADGRKVTDWATDESGHGTHVAGIIAAGSMANVQILPLRVFVGSNNQISMSAFYDAVNYVCQLQKRLNIVAANLSLGSPGITDDKSSQWRTNMYAYQPYINQLRNAGILPVVAAGNIDRGAGEVNTNSYYAFPAACAGAVAVSAYYRDYLNQPKLASFSYWNNRISIAAPGLNIWSACCAALQPASVDDLEPQKGSERLYYYPAKEVYLWANSDGTYSVRMQGTSMATPFVSLCYALIRSDPTKTTADSLGVTWDEEVDTQAPFYYLNPQHKALLLNATDFTLSTNAEDVNKTDQYFGYGGVNVRAFAQTAVTKQPSKTAEDVLTPSLPEYADYILASSSDTQDWANVFWVLCGVILLLGLLNFVRGLLIGRRRTNGDSE